jgi:anti-sigma factor RsiW
MNPKQIEQLQAYFDGEQTPEERIRMEAVIGASAECRELLKQWGQQRRALQLLKKTDRSDEAFVSRVMTRLEELTVPEPEPVQVPEFVRWLFPAVGYALSAILVFVTFSVKHPGSVSAETILLSEVPQETRGVFVKSSRSDVSQMFATEEM